MATIAYVIRAVNDASRVLNDVATSAAKLDVAMDKAQRTADALNSTLTAQNLAAGAASAGLERVARNAYAAAAAQSAYTAALKDSTVAAAESGAAATVVVSRWGGVLGLLGGLRGNKVPLFGGSGVPAILASVGAVHLLVDVTAEFLAVAIPAGIALAAFGALAAGPIVDMYNQLVNVQKVVTATGRSIYPFTGGIARLQAAMQPEILRLYGDALDVMGQKTGELGVLAIGTGKVLDNFANRVSAAITSGGMDIFLKNAVTDVKGLGDVLGNVLGIFGNLLKSVPGYAAVILNGFKGVTGFLESFTSSGFVQGVAKVGLAAHGAAIYVGLLGTAAGFLVSKGLSVAGGLLGKAADVMGRFGIGSLEASSAVRGLGATLTGASALPWTWIALGAAAVGVLIYKLLTAKDAAQQFISSLNAKVAAAPAAQGLQAIGQAMASVNAQIRAMGPVTQTMTFQGGRAGALAGPLLGGTGNASDLAAWKAELVTLGGQATAYNAVLGKLARQYGSVQLAQLLVSQSGLTNGQVLTKNASQAAQDAVAYQSVYDVYKAVGAQSIADVAVMGRLNGKASEQVSAISSLNGAWDSYLAAITGAQTSFDTYGQGLATLNSAQKTAVNHLRDYSNAVKLTGAVMDGTSQASIALNQAFTTQVTQTGALIDSWRTAGITGNLLATGVKNALAPMLKFASGSHEATAQLIALASEAGYQGPETLKALSGWLGITHDSLKKVKEISDLATQQEALLTSAFQGQGAVLANQLIGDLNTAYLKYNNVYGAVNAYAKAVTDFGTKSQQARTARTNLITDLTKAGQAAHDSTGKIGAMISKILHIPLRRAIQLVVNAEGQWKVLDASTHVGSPFNISSAVPHAAGGLVRGGIPGVDSVPILAQAGEVVVPRHLVDSGAVAHLRGQIPGYAAGGVVGSYSSSGPNGPSGLGTFTQQQYNATVSAVVSATAAATASGITAAMTSSGPISGTVVSWLRAALAIDRAPVSWLGALGRIVSLESGGNPRAYNPSGASGLMQMMPGTFAEYARGGGSIFNPIANAAAAIRYIEATYGSPFGIPNLYSGHYLGYDSGGMLPPGLTMAVNRTGAPERVMGPGEDKGITSRLDTIASLLDELCDISAGGQGNVASAVSGVPLAGAGQRLAGYKQMMNTRG